MTWMGFRLEPATARELLEDSERFVAELMENQVEEPQSGTNDTVVDLDKAWHGLHWLLNESGEPTNDSLSEIILGGEEVGEEIAYGPGRLLGAAEVKNIAESLSVIDVGTMRARMNPSQMISDEIYPSIWEEEGIFEDYLAPAFIDLKDFYTAAAAAHQAVIQVIC